MDQTTPILPNSSQSNKTNKFVYILTFFSAIGGFLFGYDTGVISGAMIILKKQFLLNDLWQELLVAITVGFAAVFSLVGGLLNSWTGRRVVVLLSSFIFTFGSVLLAVATNKEMLLSGRAIVGAGIGLSSMTVPMYIAEVSPPNVRGRLVTINNLFITGGQFVASCIDGFFSTDEVNGWRFMLGLAAVPAFIQLIGFLFLPESPRWLMEKKKYDKAIVSLQKIVGDAVEAQKEYEQLQGFIEGEKNTALNSGGFCRLLRDSGVRRALIVGCGLQMFQQLAGINTVMYYSATIIQMSGVRDDTLAIWLAAATAFVNFLFTFLGVWLVERMGRRPLTLLSLAGVTFSLLFLSSGFYLSSIFSPNVMFNVTSGPDTRCLPFDSCTSCIESYHCGYCYVPRGQWQVQNATCLPFNGSNPLLSEFGPCETAHNKGFYFATNYCPTSYSWMALLGMVLYLVFFAPGMGPMPWTINSEIYPQWARSSGNAISTTTNWLFNVLISLTFLDVTKLLTTEGAFFLYAMLSLTGLIFIFLFLPETKGKQLEEVERLFQSPGVVCCRRNTETYHVILNNRVAPEDSDEDTLFSK